jgi:CheY-like chemotaxis protein
MGSRFTVLLPIAALRPAEAKLPTTAEPEDQAFPARSLEGFHVMVVDDEPGVRDLVALTLAKCGASVTVASSVEQALGLMPNLSPDVIVSDIAMPGVDGYEFIRQIRALLEPRRAEVPVIALTAYASIQDRARAMELGFDRHLTKPVDPAELVRAIVQTKASRA